MPDSQNRPVRRSIRLSHANYSHPGAYFVTICACRMERLFGTVEHGRVRLSHVGEIAHSCWLEIPQHFPNVRTDKFVVMPNHLHGVLVIEQRARHAVPLREPIEALGKPVHGSVPTIVCSYKSAVTHLTRKHLGKQTFQLWQSNYFERILRDGDEFSNAVRYILENPLMWHLHKEPRPIWTP